MKVYATQYSYMDGTDTTAHPDRDAAIRMACKIILDWIDDVEDQEVKVEILQLIMEGELEKAVRTWGRWQYENLSESISVLELPLLEEPSEENLCERAHELLFG